MTGLKLLSMKPLRPRLMNTTASDKLKELYEFNMSNPIYLSNEVGAGVRDIVDLGIAKLTKHRSRDTTVNTKYRF